MLKRFKEMILDAVIEGEAKFRLNQRDSLARFDNGLTGAASNRMSKEELADMMNPQKVMQRLQAANSSPVVVVADTREQDIKDMKREVRQEISSMPSSVQDGICLSALTDYAKGKAVDNIIAIRDKSIKAVSSSLNTPK